MRLASPGRGGAAGAALLVVWLGLLAWSMSEVDEADSGDATSTERALAYVESAITANETSRVADKPAAEVVEHAAASEADLELSEYGTALDSIWNSYVPGIDFGNIEATISDLLARAEAGEPLAYRHLMRLAQLCPPGAQDSSEHRANIEDLYARDVIDAEGRNMLINGADTCDIASPLLPERDWFALGRAAGDPVLLIMEEARAGPRLLASALAPAIDPDPMMVRAHREAVLSVAYTLDPVVLRTLQFWSHGPRGTSTRDEELRFFAWDLLICRVEPFCRDAAAERWMERELYAYEWTAVRAEAQALELLIRRGGIAEHDLRTNARDAH